VFELKDSYAQYFIFFFYIKKKKKMPKRCRHENCVNMRRDGYHCLKHGGGTCKLENCNSASRLARGYCKKHMNEIGYIKDGTLIDDTRRDCALHCISCDRIIYKNPLSLECLMCQNICSIANCSNEKKRASYLCDMHTQTVLLKCINISCRRTCAKNNIWCGVCKYICKHGGCIKFICSDNDDFCTKHAVDKYVYEHILEQDFLEHVL
jgi:hypothetical protein